MGSRDRKKICVFVKTFPVLSQTFVLQQIVGLIDAGQDVKVISLNKGDYSLFAEYPDYDLDSKSIVLLDEQPAPRRRSMFGKMLKTIPKVFSKYRLFSLYIYLLLKKKNSQAFEIQRLILLTLPRIGMQFDSIIAHFGHVGVIANCLIQSGQLEGRLSTVFHGYEISEHEQIKLWGSQYKTLASESHLLLPISQLWKDRLVSMGCAPEKIEVVHMGINLNSFTFQPKPFNNVLQIVTVARATEKKGLYYSVKGVLDFEIPSSYSIVGDGELLLELKALVPLNTESINFLGAQKPSEIATLLSKADVFVLTSVTSKDGDMEGIPVSLMEAMAKGVVVLSTYHSGIPELISDGVNGFLVREKDSQSISAKLMDIYKAKDIEKIQFHARKTIEEHFNQDLLIQKLIKLV